MSRAASSDVRCVTLPPEPASSGRCRDLVRSAYEDWGIRSSPDDALLLVSELSSNVIRHAGTPMVVSVTWDPAASVVHVSVRDDSPALPVDGARDELGDSGRGLRIVRSIARRWGVERLAVGKDVWFDLRVDGRAPPGNVTAAVRAD